MHLAVDSHGMPVRMTLTGGTTADCTQAPDLIANVVAQYLLADRGYDSDAVVAQAEKQGMEAAIPPRRNRKKPGTTTGRCTSCVTWWKTHSEPSSNGVEWRPDTPRMKPHSWQSAKSVQW